MSRPPKYDPELEPIPLEPGFDTEEAAAPEPEAPEKQYCIFRTGRERFCIDVLDVDEVVEWPRLTRLPLAPPFLMGVFNLRGTIVPVIDIAFEVRRPDLTPRQIVVACQRGGQDEPDIQAGIAVDEVIGTYSTREPLLTDEAPREVPFCAGMLRHGERLAIALDFRRVLESYPVGVV